MYIKDDICYAGELSDEIEIIEAQSLNGRMILVTFSTGEKRIFDTTLLKGSAFEPLSDEKFFNSLVLFHGFITWNNGEIDIAPEAVYKYSYEYNSEMI